MYVCLSVCMYVCVCVCVCVCVYIYICLCVWMCGCMCGCTCMYVCMYVCMYIIKVYYIKILCIRLSCACTRQPYDALALLYTRAQYSLCARACKHTRTQTYQRFHTRTHAQRARWFAKLVALHAFLQKKNAALHGFAFTQLPLQVAYNILHI